MTQHFDEEAARRRLEADKERVQGLIAVAARRGSRPGGRRSGRRSRARHRPGRPGVGDVRAREGHRDPRTARARSRRDRSRVATARRRHLRHRRGHRRADRARAPRGVSDRAHQRRQRAVVTVTLRLFAAAREAAGRGRDEYDRPAAPTVGALLDAATRRVRPDVRPGARNSRVWVNGDEPHRGPGHGARRRRRGRRAPPVSGGARPRRGSPPWIA